MIRIRPRLHGVLTGLAVTLVGAVFFAATETGAKLELLTYDWRVRYAGNIPPACPIVHVDIDDGSLDRVGRWPWRRDQLAAIIGTLGELGAKRIVVDFLLSEYEQPIINDPRYGPYSDVEPVPELLGDFSEENVVFGDLELAGAIRSVGNLYLAVQTEVVAPDQPGPLRERLRQYQRRGTTAGSPAGAAVNSLGRKPWVSDAREQAALWGRRKTPSSNASAAPSGLTTAAQPRMTVDAPDGLLDPAPAIAAVGLRDTPTVREKVRAELVRLAISDQLARQFTLDSVELAGRLHCDLAEVSAVLAGVKSAVADELVAGLFADGPPPALDVVLESVLGREKDRDNADRRDVLSAYRRNLGLSATKKRLFSESASISGRCYRGVALVPPYFQLVEAARGVGTVNFSPDIDGGVRRLPIVVEWRGQMVPHLGFAVACDALGLDAARMELTRDRKLVLPSASGEAARIVPLDARGNLIIPWTATAKSWRQGSDYQHISAAKVWSLAEKRRDVERNQTAIDYKYAEVVAAAKGEFTVLGGPALEGEAVREGEPPAEPLQSARSGPGPRAAGERYASETIPADEQFRRKVNEQLVLRRRARLARLRGVQPEEEVAALELQAAAMLAEIREQQRLAVSTVELACHEFDAIPPDELAGDPDLSAEAARYRRVRDLVHGDIARLQAANERLEQDARLLRQELTGSIKDKYTFFGYAATATGDIVTTPIDPRTIGVMCHAQVLSSFLQGRFIEPPPDRLGLLIGLGLGTAAVFVTAFRGPKLALLVVAAMMLLYALLNAYVVFRRWDAWVPLAGPLITAAVTWAAVTLFRQLTAEREKRFFAKQLSQYTSPAIAASLAESPEAAQAFKTVQSREVTCWFSDLKGFTTITERENAEAIQYVLNTYLERMCRVIWSNRGLINKFMGDGIMAFFNASVDPVADHQRVACEAGLLALDELERLKAEQRGRPTGRIFEQLEMRIGLASGLCLNGDMGSELKADYTVIGDVVNLAARLEPANKVFGTRLMVPGMTRDAVAELYEFRYLAELRVKGKSQTAPVYEVVCRKGELNEEQSEYIRRFEAGVDLYKSRKWDECIVHFTRMLARKPDDAGASRYIDACQEFKVFAPEEGWCGALELKEK